MKTPHPPAHGSALVKTSAFLLLFCLLAACGDANPPPATQPPAVTAEAQLELAATPTAAPVAAASANCSGGGLPPFVKEIVLATSVQGANIAPVNPSETFGPKDSIFLVATLQNPPANSRLKAAWYLLYAEGYDTAKITEHEEPVRSGNVAFSLLPVDQQPWPAGWYCVELYANGALASSRLFQVIPDGAAPTTNPVVRVVMAENFDAETRAPVNPTTVFAMTAPAIYATVQIKDAPANTVFKARWYPPGTDPLEHTLTTDGSRWMQFKLTPPEEGFPPGAYKVEIYHGDVLAQAHEFAVQ
jgi:hypothetical protein